MLQARSGHRYDYRPRHNIYRLAVKVPSGSVYSQALVHHTHFSSCLSQSRFLTSLSCFALLLIFMHTPSSLEWVGRRAVLNIQIITNQSYCTAKDMTLHIMIRQTKCVPSGIWWLMNHTVYLALTPDVIVQKRFKF